MIPLIISCRNESSIDEYLTQKGYRKNLVMEIFPEKDSIGLPAIKQLKDSAKFSLSPNSLAVFIIHNGHTMTVPAQNSLLKTIEESKPWQQFIITTINSHHLLETITSRCQLISLNQNLQVSVDQTIIKSFINGLASTPQIINETDKIIDSDPKAYLTTLIDHLRVANRNFPTYKRLQIIRLATSCLQTLDTNINQKLTLDNFLLKSRKIIANSLK